MVDGDRTLLNRDNGEQDTDNGTSLNAGPEQVIVESTRQAPVRYKSGVGVTKPRVSIIMT